jgi:hypothetical protein
LNCRPKKFKTGETQTKTAKSKQKSGKSNYKICEIQKNRFLFGFCQFFVWISRIFERIWEIQTIMRENPNKKQFFYSLDFADFMLGFPVF